MSRNVGTLDTAILSRRRLVLETLEPRLMLSGSSAPELVGVLPGGGASQVYVYATGDAESVDLSSIQVAAGKGDAIKGITLTGEGALGGAGLVIVNASSVGSIKDLRTGDVAPLAFIATSAPIKSLSLLSGLSGYDLNGLALDGMAFAEDVDGDGDTTDATALFSSASLGAVTLGGDVEGDVRCDAAQGDCLLKLLTVRDGSLLGDIVCDGSIGALTVVGGDLVGSVISENGVIGAITVIGVSFVDEDGEGSVRGGNLLSPVLDAASVGGRSIGNIMLIGGNFGSDDQPVVIDVPGNVGNIVVRKLRYVESVTEAEVLDKNGDLVEDANGDPVYRYVKTYAWQGGSIWTSLTTAGSVGNLTTCGGDLDGAISAAKGIGVVTVQSLLRYAGSCPANLSSVNLSKTGDEILGGDLLASLSASPGEGLMAIRKISVLGGDLKGDVDVLGTIGGVLLKGILEGSGDDYEFSGGNFQSDTFHATKVGNISMRGGSFESDVAADQTIGNLTVVGGGIEGSLTARDAIGNVTAKALTRNAKASRSWIGDFLDGWWDTDILAGQCWGGPCELAVYLGGTDDNVNPLATLGKIVGIGVDVLVEGDVPFAPGLASVSSKECRFVRFLEENFFGRLIADYLVVGGGVTNRLVQLAL